jgi:hypothetical protein
MAGGAVEDVEAVAALGVPEPGKACPGLLQEARRRTRRACEPPRRLRGEAQAAQPKRVDLDRLADPRGHHPVPDLGIHPGQLHPGLAGGEEPIRGIDPDPISACRHHVIDDGLRAPERTRPARPSSFVPGRSPRSRGRTTSVASTVLYSGVVPASGKRLGDHAPVHHVGEAAQDRARHLGRPGHDGSRPGRPIMVSRPQSANQWNPAITVWPRRPSWSRVAR